MFIKGKIHSLRYSPGGKLLISDGGLKVSPYCNFIIIKSVTSAGRFNYMIKIKVGKIKRIMLAELI